MAKMNYTRRVIKIDREGGERSPRYLWMQKELFHVRTQPFGVEEFEECVIRSEATSVRGKDECILRRG